MVIGSDPVPVEINGVVTHRIDLSVMRDEADTILIHHVLAVKPNRALFICDDTDVFVLLCHFVNNGSIKGQVKMRSCKRSVIYTDINATVSKYQGIMNDLLPSHGLTGCDTVAVCYGIGKTTAINTLRTGKYPLDALGNISSSVEEVMSQATAFMLYCYGHPECSSLTEARQKIWSAKVASNVASAPKLKSLPPTNESFLQNVLRAHLQVAVWRNCADRNPPDLDPEYHGFVKDGDSLKPVPDEILRVVKCGCTSTFPCQSTSCSCHKAGMPCTEFCKCCGETGHCFNPNTKHSEDDSDDDNDDDSETNEEEIH